MAGNAFLECGVVAVFGQDGAAAGVAEQVRAFFQPMPHRHAAVKDETFALPCALLGGHLFQIFQDAALEVIDLLDPLPQQVIRAFLAADAAGAEHGDALVVEAVLVRLPPCRKVAETGGLRIDCALEGADRHLVVIAGVDHGDIGRGDERVPVGRFDVMADAGQRVHVGLAHRDDLALQPHFHPGEGRRAGGAFLPFQIGAARQGADMGQNSVDGGAGAGDGAVDPFARQKQRAGHALRAAQRGQPRLDRGGVVKAREVIEGGDSIHGARFTPRLGCVQARRSWLIDARRARP